MENREIKLWCKKNELDYEVLKNIAMKKSKSYNLGISFWEDIFMSGLQEIFRYIKEYNKTQSKFNTFCYWHYRNGIDKLIGTLKNGEVTYKQKSFETFIYKIDMETYENIGVSDTNIIDFLPMFETLTEEEKCICNGILDGLNITNTAIKCNLKTGTLYNRLKGIKVKYAKTN